MESFFSGFAILINFKIYLIVLVGMLIYLPYAAVSQGFLISSLKKETQGLFIFSWLQNMFVGVGLQTFSEVFIYANIIAILLFNNDLNLMFVFELLYNDIDTIFLLMVPTFILLLFVSATDFEFLTGIVLAGIIAGQGVPPIPDFFTIMWIILAAILVGYLGPLLMFPIVRLFGNWDLFKEVNSVSPGLYNQNIVEILASIYIQKIVMLIPVAIYIDWLVKNYS